MTNVLILTKPDDHHSILVKLALEKKGQECSLMYTTDLPEYQKHSFLLKDKNIHWKCDGLDFSVNNLNEFDVVWYRRPRRPVLPDLVHSDDVENAMNENIELMKTMWQVISPEAFWVNPFNVRNIVNSKLKQLHVAKNIGFNVPETLISNDPREIRRFIINTEDRPIIYKSLSPLVWFNEEDMRLVYTREVSVDQLPSDYILQATPGIFQNKINKAFELRVTFLGNTAITAKLRSQEHPKGLQDWRYVPGHELSVDTFELPDTIHRMCKEFMEHFGIVFGCFDFIVTPEGEYYFLEINEQGQFLWVEDINPDIKMLDAFSDFLISKSSDFVWKPTENALSSNDFAVQMMAYKDVAIANHKVPVEKC